MPMLAALSVPRPQHSRATQGLAPLVVYGHRRHDSIVPPVARFLTHAPWVRNILPGYWQLTGRAG